MSNSTIISRDNTSKRMLLQQLNALRPNYASYRVDLVLFLSLKRVVKAFLIGRHRFCNDQTILIT